MRWHPLMIRLGLQIQAIDPKVSDMLNKTGILHLPDERTCYDYSHFEKTKPGIIKPTINALEEKMLKYAADEEFRRFHFLMVDEMTISENLVFSKSSGELTGFVDLLPVDEALRELDVTILSLSVTVNENGENSEENSVKGKKKKRNTKPPTIKDTVYNPPMAKKMLTYMVKGVASAHKHVVATYGVDNLSAADL